MKTHLLISFGLSFLLTSCGNDANQDGTSSNPEKKPSDASEAQESGSQTKESLIDTPDSQLTNKQIYKKYVSKMGITENKLYNATIHPSIQNPTGPKDLVITFRPEDGINPPMVVISAVLDSYIFYVENAFQYDDSLLRLRVKRNGVGNDYILNLFHPTQDYLLISVENTIEQHIVQIK